MTSEGGFSLVESLVATLLVVTGLGGAAQLLVASAQANERARVITSATELARDKLEQLRGLAYGVDESGALVTDVTTDTRVAPDAPSGGTGLSPSPSTALGSNVDGYCDFLDAGGRLLPAGGIDPPASAMYVRRWSIEPLQDDPARALAVHVRVVPVQPSLAVEAVHLTGVRVRRPL